MKTINHKLLLYYVFKKVFFLHCIYALYLSEINKKEIATQDDLLNEET